MNIHIKNISLLITFFMFYQVSAQSAKEVLKKVIKSYQTHQKYTVKMTYQYVNLNKSDKIIEEENAFFVTNNNQKYYKVENKIEIIDNGTVTIQINHIEKEMIVSKSLIASISKFDFDFDSLKLFSNISIKRQTKNTIVLLFSTKPITQLPYSSLELFIDKKNYMVRKQIFYYLSRPNYLDKKKKNEMIKPRLTVKYSNYKFNIDYTHNNLFKNNTYYRQKNTGLTGVGKYAKYSIINNLKNKI